MSSLFVVVLVVVAVAEVTLAARTRQEQCCGDRDTGGAALAVVV